jgi:hypothetical protein
MSTTRRLIDWRIEPGEASESYTLHRRNRPVLSDSGMGDIWKYLHRHRQQGETVVFRRSPDDMPTNVTDKLDRRHPDEVANPRRIRLSIFPLRR